MSDDQREKTSAGAIMLACGDVMAAICDEGYGIDGVRTDLHDRNRVTLELELVVTKEKLRELSLRDGGSA